MRLDSLYLFQFRKISDRAFDFSEGINVIVGDNAQGKTTLLEAINFLITGRSFRTSRASDLFQMGTKKLALSSRFHKQSIEQKLSICLTDKEKSIEYNATRSCSLASVLGLLIGSVMTPDDASLIKGSPQSRRTFVDIAIESTDPLYTWHLSRYSRALKQRNILLKTNHLNTCESWEYELSHSAAYLTFQRKKALRELNEFFKDKYALLGEPHEEASLVFLSPQDETEEGLKAYYIREYARLRKKESLLGFTLIGPHRDDLAIFLQGKEARVYASEGQKQTLLAALKLAEWQRLHKSAEEKPLFMIDDMGVSLDSKRKARFYKEIEGMGQVFITSTEAPHLSRINTIRL